MGGPSSNSSDDSKGGGTYSAQLKTIQRKKKVVDFIKGGGVVGTVVRAVSKNIKETKAKKDKQNSLDYEGDALGTKSSNFYKSKDARTGEDNNNDPNPKSIEQPKVKSQMNNSEVKSDLITASGPTDIEMANTTEMSEEEKLIKRKRGKKTKTILSSVTGDNSQATLSQKTLLG